MEKERPEGWHQSIMGISRIQPRGQVTIPAKVRKACSLRSGDHVFFEVKDGSVIEVRVLPERTSVTEMIQRYQVPGTASMSDLREKMAMDIVSVNLPESESTKALTSKSPRRH